MDEFTGNLIIIGGAEDKLDNCEILKEVIKVSQRKSGPLIVLTTASSVPQEVGRVYINTFKHLNFDNYEILTIKSRDEANIEEYGKKIKESGGIFFTGGDQLRITSMIGGTNLYESLKLAAQNGVTIVGTSAGASCVCTTMIVSGLEEDAPKKCTIKMAPGLDLIKGVLIDQHFSQRGRIGRLLNAVAQNPEILGIGIDEDTAIVIGQDTTFKVFGSGSVTVIDGKQINFTNVSEVHPDEALTISGAKIHVLSRGYRFDIKNRIMHTS